MIVRTRQPRSDSEWVALGPASRLVGVDPDTLRRWADAGTIEVFSTPGGHRRFSRRALEALVANRPRRRAPLARLGTTPHRVIAAYRRRLGRRPSAANSSWAGTAWMNEMDPVARAEFRDRCGRLTALLVEYVGSGGEAGRSASIEAAAVLGRETGSEAAGLGLALSDATAAFLSSRQPFIDELAAAARRRGLSADETGRVFSDASDALDRVLLAFIDGHAHARGTAGASRP